MVLVGSLLFVGLALILARGPSIASSARGKIDDVVGGVARERPQVAAAGRDDSGAAGVVVLVEWPLRAGAPSRDRWGPQDGHGALRDRL